jgi:hypothetical protein
VHNQYVRSSGSATASASGSASASGGGGGGSSASMNSGGMHTARGTNGKFAPAGAPGSVV